MKSSANKNGAYRKSGFTLVEIMIVVAVVGLLAAIAVPNFINARTKSLMNTCIGNLRQIDSAVQQWSIENNQGNGAPVTQTDLVPYLSNGNVASVGAIHCPNDSSKSFASSYQVVDTSTRPMCRKVPGPGFGTHELN